MNLPLTPIQTPPLHLPFPPLPPPPLPLNHHPPPPPTPPRILYLILRGILHLQAHLEAQFQVQVKAANLIRKIFFELLYKGHLQSNKNC